MSQQDPSKDSPTRPSLEQATRKRPLSERRIQANRRNALRSTGPTTGRGKRTVALGAIKHGVLAREVVITAGDGKEDLNEFHNLVGRLCDLYQPVGVVEESLVQTIVTCWWRKARVIRAENGEIRKRLDTLEVDLALRNSDEVNLELALSEMDLDIYRPGNQADQTVSSRERWSTIQVAQTILRGHRSGLAYLTALLQHAKSEIASEGHISAMVRKKILLAFSFWDCLFSVACVHAGLPETKLETRPATETNAKEADNGHSLIMALIDERLERISNFEGLAKEREGLTRDGGAGSSVCRRLR